MYTRADKMHVVKWIVVVLGALQGGWLLFDGVRALTVGDYVTATSGPRAGQLGPWSKIVAAVGLEPRGTPVKLLHVGCGIAWLVAAICFAIGTSFAWWLTLVCAVCTLWYLPIGTVASLVVLGLLLFAKQ
jgi:hypothetical protein